MPVCVDNNLLDKREYLYENPNGIFYNSVGTDSTIKPAARDGPHPCRLLKYTAELAVTCIDTLYISLITMMPTMRQPHRTNCISSSLAIREFANSSSISWRLDEANRPSWHYIKWWINYDSIHEMLLLIGHYSAIPGLRSTSVSSIHNQINENTFNHVDVDWWSSMLKLRVSFKWQPLINDDVMEMFRQWAAEEQTHKPYLIFVSIICRAGDYFLTNDFIILWRTLGQVLEATTYVSR